MLWPGHVRWGWVCFQSARNSRKVEILSNMHAWNVDDKLLRKTQDQSFLSSSDISQKASINRDSDLIYEWSFLNVNPSLIRMIGCIVTTWSIHNKIIHAYIFSNPRRVPAGSSEPLLVAPAFCAASDNNEPTSSERCKTCTGDLSDCRFHVSSFPSLRFCTMITSI